MSAAQSGSRKRMRTRQSSTWEEEEDESVEAALSSAEDSEEMSNDTDSDDDSLKFPDKKAKRMRSLSGKVTRTRKQPTVQSYLSSVDKLLQQYASKYLDENDGKRKL